MHHTSTVDTRYTHWHFHINAWGRTCSHHCMQQTVNNQTHHNPAHPTGSRSLPAVHTTADTKTSKPYPFGKTINGKYVRKAVPNPAGPPAAGETSAEAMDTQIFQSLTADTPITDTLPAANADTSYGGANYIRWGRTSCPTVSGTQEIYSGVTAGTYFSYSGGASNYLCLVKDGQYQPGAVTGNSYATYIYGTEYETRGRSLASLHDHNVPCAACLATTRTGKIMVPGTTACPSGWTTEYTGWLMSGYYAHAGRTENVCVDKDAEPLAGQVPDTNGALMYHSVVACGASYPGIPCPPYVNAKDLACAVCTI